MSLYGPYPARVVSIHDGDTLSLDLDLGFGFFLNAQDWSYKPKLSCRIFGINSPELSTAAGKNALAYAKTIVRPGDICSVVSHGWDKFGGRFDGTLALPDGRDFATLMLGSGNAVPYAP